MIKATRGVLAALLAATLLFGFVAPGRSEGAAQTKCPVIGGFVNKRVFADYKGKRVYFCCPPCIRSFQQEPEKYITLLENQGVVLEEVPNADRK